METAAPSFTQKISALVIALLMLGLAAVCTLTSLRWIGTPFPGFFLLENRVVASVTLPHWPISEPHPNLLQSEVVAVNGTPLVSAESLYTLVRSLPPGTFVEYTMRKRGRSVRLTMPTFVFTWQDYALIFGAYLFTALTIAGIGIGVWFLTPATPASRALLIAGVVTGVFGVTGLDLYAPFHFFRLHVLAEALLSAGYMHLVLVFPVDRLRRLRTPLLVLPYLVSLLLAVACEIFLYQPSRYALFHNLSMVQVGVATPIFLGRFVWDYVTTRSPLVRQRIRVILVGFLSGYGFPATLMFLSGIRQGEVAVNAMAFTAFLFPLSIGYAIVKHDLFEIDAFLKRWVFYLILTAVLTLMYVSSLAVLNFTLRSSDFVSSPLFPLLFVLGVVFLLQPLKEYVQRGVDRVFFRVRYNPKQVLEATSASLASTLELDKILTVLWRTIRETVGVRQGGVFLLLPRQSHYVLTHPERAPEQAIASSHPVLAHLRRHGRALPFLDIPSSDSPSVQDPLPAALTESHAQLLVPLLFEANLIGFLILGPKSTGRFFSAADVDFLSTLANQGALAIANALAYQEIQDLNRDLENQVSQVREKEQEVVRSFDNERFSDPHALGLVGMQERARLIGGSVEITSILGAGVKVVLTVPIPTTTVPVTIGQENYDYDPYR